MTQNLYYSVQLWKCIQIGWLTKEQASTVDCCALSHSVLCKSRDPNPLWNRFCRESSP